MSTQRVWHCLIKGDTNSFSNELGTAILADTSNVATNLGSGIGTVILVGNSAMMEV